MDLWDREAIDLVGPAFIEFDSKGNGAFGFIAVEDVVDGRRSMSADRPRLDFTWEDSDEGDPVTGRDWVELERDGSMRGHIFFRLGDDSAFRAVKDPKARRRRRAAPSDRVGCPTAAIAAVNWRQRRRSPTTRA
jgi:hypothetical protein